MVLRARATTKSADANGRQISQTQPLQKRSIQSDRPSSTCLPKSGKSKGMQANPFQFVVVGNQFAGRTLYRRSRDEFLSRRSKAPAPRAPSPPLGLFFFGHFRSRSLGEQFCTDGYCQGVQARMTGDGSVLMSETDQFWEYAKEAMLLACDAKTAKDKQDLLELSGTWTQAALQS